MVGEHGGYEDHPSAAAPRADGRRSWMPLYLATFFVAVVALERLIDRVLA